MRNISGPPSVKVKTPVKWGGRYGRIFGNQASTFRIKYINGEWWPVTTMVEDDSTFVCPAVDCLAARDLVEVVNEGKTQLSHSDGGAFVINEFGQIIVPSSFGNGERLYVGDLIGDLQFINPDTDEEFSFNDDEELDPGDKWQHPYVGTLCHLSKRKRIYAIIEDDDEKEAVFPDIQDGALISQIQSIRGYRGVRFIVNHHGIVLTKKEDDFEEWRPVYVGRINYNKWFYKE